MQAAVLPSFLLAAEMYLAQDRKREPSRAAGRAVSLSRNVYPLLGFAAGTSLRQSRLGPPAAERKRGILRH